MLNDLEYSCYLILNHLILNNQKSKIYFYEITQVVGTHYYYYIL